MGEGHPQAGDGCWAQVPAGEAPARDPSRGLHVSLYWTGAHLSHLDLPSLQDLSSLMPSAAFGLVDHSHLDTPELNFLALKTPTSPLPPSLGLLASFLPSPATSQSSLCPCSPYPWTFSGLCGDPSTCLSTILQATASTVSQFLHPYCQPALTPGPGSHLPPAAFLESVAQFLKLNEFTAECFISLSLWGSRA